MATSSDPEAKFEHAEAFCVMSYADEQTGEMIRVWNTRDGVTPFCVGNPAREGGIMRHVNWNDDRRDPFWPLREDGLKEGDHIFVDATMELALPVATRIVEQIEAAECDAGAEPRSDEELEEEAQRMASRWVKERAPWFVKVTPEMLASLRERARGRLI